MPQIKKDTNPDNWNKNIPIELKERKQWVLWKLIKRSGQDKPTKIPFQINDKRADSMDTETWNTFEQVVLTYTQNPGVYNGIGFVFSENDEYLGIDIDDCMDNPNDPHSIRGEGSNKEKGVSLLHNVKYMVEKVLSYTEISQSGNGIHMIVKAKMPGKRNRKGQFEFYDRGRYFAFTGNLIDWTPPTIMENQAGVNAVYNFVFAPEPKKQQTVTNHSEQVAVAQLAAAAEPSEPVTIDPSNMSDATIIKIASKSKIGFKFHNLLNGTWASDYKSQSEADQAFCNMLAFYTKDPYQIDRIFKNSGLYRAKWDRLDYKNPTIERAISDVTASYTGGKKAHLKLVKEDQAKDDKKEEDKHSSKEGNSLRDKCFDVLNEIHKGLLEKLYKINYSIDKDGNLCALRYDKEGELHLDPIANFIAWPTKEVQKDNGIEKLTKFEIEGVTADGVRLPKALVPSDKFSQMQWMLDNWGLKTVMQPGSTIKDKVRYVIQTLGTDVPKELLYGHLGWRNVEGKWVYLHAGGAIGSALVITSLEDEGLTAYELPDQVEDAKSAVEFALKIIDVAPKNVTIPLFALTYLAPLCEPLRTAGIEPAFILWLSGTTGSMKSTLAALFLSHFGRFTAKSLPASFKDTANALERKSFFTKDSILVVDDYHPNASQGESVKMRDTAERLLRIYGDRTGRGRLNADSTAKKTFIPKGLCLVTGEDHPEGGQSAAARYLGLDIEKGQMNTKLLSEIQNQSEMLSGAMRSYISNLDVEVLPKTLKALLDKLRAKASQEGQHSRIPEVVAWLQIGVKFGLEHAEKLGVITELDKSKMLFESWEILLGLAEKQSKVVEGETPERKFVAAFNELLNNNTLRTYDAHMGRGLSLDFAGWHDADWYYLLPGTVYNAVNKFYLARGAQLPVTEKILWKHLEQAGFIKVENDGKQLRRTFRKTFNGERIMILQLRKSALDETAQEAKTTITTVTQESIFKDTTIKK